MAKSAIEVEGVRDLHRAFRRVSKDMAKAYNDELRDIGRRVRDDARSIAYQKNTRRTGDLARGIKHSVKRQEVRIASKAEHGGFAYPRRLEFEGRGGGTFGPRASVFPAVERNRRWAGDRLDGAAERVALKFNTGG